MVRSKWQEVPPRYTCTINTFDTRDYGYLNAIRLLGAFGECQAIAQTVARRLLVPPFMSGDFRDCYLMRAYGNSVSAALNHQDWTRARFILQSDRTLDIPQHQRITSVAWKRSEGGMVRPSAWAVLRLMTRSNCMGRSTGRSAGLVPLRILSTYVARLRQRPA
jgi:hypothetical protein